MCRQRACHQASISVTRVPAHEVEVAIVEAVQQHLNGFDIDSRGTPLVERELIERHVQKAIVKPQSIEIHLTGDSQHRNKSGRPKSGRHFNSKSTRPTFITVPWTATASPAAKGVVHAPSHKSPMNEESREELLTAIAKARAWIEDLAEGLLPSLAEIARKEGKVERHIRLLAQLAFVSPQIILAIVERTALPTKVTALAKVAVPSWTTQQQRLKILP